MSIRIFFLLTLMCTALNAQVVCGGSVGNPQVVVDPTGGTGLAVLEARFRPAIPSLTTQSSLTFELSGLPSYYASAAPSSEIVAFFLELGASSAPGIPVLGGEFYLPNVAPVSFGPTPPTPGYLSHVHWLGPVGFPSPGDVICSSGVNPPSRIGSRLVWNSPPLSAAGVPLTVQVAMFDPALGRVFTSNALNMSL